MDTATKPTLILYNDFMLEMSSWNHEYSDGEKTYTEGLYELISIEGPSYYSCTAQEVADTQKNVVAQDQAKRVEIKPGQKLKVRPANGARVYVTRFRPRAGR
jgi:hypothetical protein